jgi:carbon-monoxide dehydrogenase medium subunit
MAACWHATHKFPDGARVKAPNFNYVRATSLAQVLQLLARYGDDAQILAGGQSLMPALNMRLSQPKLLIDINGLDALKGIGIANGHVRIGALTRHVELAGAPTIAQHLPLITEAMPHVAHLAVRNRGTFGGSIALADPAAELPACALALEAHFVLESVAGRRQIAAADFFKGLYATARRSDELLLEALIPIPPPSSQPVFLELARRHGDFALAGLAFQLTIEAGSIADGRLAYFASDDRPKLGHAVLAAIKGKHLTPALAEAAVAQLATDLDPISSVHGSAKLRLHWQRLLTRRALELARLRASVGTSAA